MRGNDELPLWVTVKEVNKDVFVWRPAAACYKYLIILLEGFYQRQLLGLLIDTDNPVKTCVACYLYIIDMKLSQQLTACFVLNEEACKALQYISLLMAIPLEEYLVFAENAADAIYRHATALQNMKIVPPELIFDKKCHLRMHHVQKASGIAMCIKRKITDNVGTLIVLSYLIT